MSILEVHIELKHNYPDIVRKLTYPDVVFISLYNAAADPPNQKFVATNSSEYLDMFFFKRTKVSKKAIRELARKLVKSYKDVFRYTVYDWRPNNPLLIFLKNYRDKETDYDVTLFPPELLIRQVVADELHILFLEMIENVTKSIIPDKMRGYFKGQVALLLNQLPDCDVLTTTHWYNRNISGCSINNVENALPIACRKYVPLVDKITTRYCGHFIDRSQHEFSIFSGNMFLSALSHWFNLFNVKSNYPIFGADNDAFNSAVTELMQEYESMAVSFLLGKIFNVGAYRYY